MSETDDDRAMPGIIEDIAELARRLAAQEPFKSATAPRPCSPSQRISTSSRADEAEVVSVTVQTRRKRGGQ